MLMIERGEPMRRGSLRVCGGVMVWCGRLSDRNCHSWVCKVSRPPRI